MQKASLESIALIGVALQGSTRPPVGCCSGDDEGAIASHHAVVLGSHVSDGERAVERESARLALLDREVVDGTARVDVYIAFHVIACLEKDVVGGCRNPLRIPVVRVTPLVVRIIQAGARPRVRNRRGQAVLQRF